MSCPRLAWLAALVAASAGACGDGSNGGDAGDVPSFDIACADGSPAVELRCPTELDLGCVAAAGAPVRYGVAAAACDGLPPAVACTPPDGSTFGPGEATVICTATAASGETATCSFGVRALPAGGFDLACAAPI